MTVTHPFLFPRFLVGLLVAFLSGGHRPGSQVQDPTVVGSWTPEKVYLQLASKAYGLDQDIWFKAVVVDAEGNRPSNKSHVLYADLIAADGSIVSHRKIRLHQGIGSGNFDADESRTPGLYTIRAYTQWNRNFGDAFLFYSQVALVGPQTEGKQEVLEDTAGTDGVNYLHAGTQGDKRNTSLIGEQAPEHLNLDHRIKNKTSIPDPATSMRYQDTLEVHFFPESGNLVHGLTKKIGFKALGADGLGRAVRGTVFDESGQPVSTFESNKLGMGVFFMRADSNHNYYAVVADEVQRDGNRVKRFPLPKVKPKGSLLSVSQVGDKLWVRVASTEIPDMATVKVSCRGKDLLLIQGSLRNGLLTKDLSSHDLPRGILVFTLTDAHDHKLAERLFFNHNHDRAPLKVALDHDSYGRRDTTAIDVGILGGETARISIMALKKDTWHQGAANTMESYFLLDSELRGNIEDPGWYFVPENPDSERDLEALMLTQGWRNYVYPVKRQGRYYYKAETGLEVHGRVDISRTRNAKFPVSITLVAFGSETGIYQTDADSLGRFHFLLNDAYGPRLPILLSAADAAGQKWNGQIRLDTVPLLETQALRGLQRSVPDTLIKVQKIDMEKRRYSITVFDSLAGVTQLDEVTVQDRRLTPKLAELYKKYGEPDVVISGDEIRAKEKKWSYGLYSILMFNYGDQVYIEQFPDGFMLAHIKAGSREPTLLMVDGKLLTKEQYEQVPHMSADLVESIELIKYAKFFKSRFLTVFPETDPLLAPSLGHIISIHTKGGVGLYASGKPSPGTLTATLPLFSPIKEFYVPSHRTPNDTNRPPDLRSLVFWLPEVSLEVSKTKRLTFPNSDLAGNYTLIIEGITPTGRFAFDSVDYIVQD